MLKHYIGFLYFRSLLGEICRELPDRKFRLCELPQNAIGYFFFDCDMRNKNGIILMGKMINISDTTYIGKEYSFEQIQSVFKEEKNLLSTMQRLGKKRAILLKNRHWHLIGDFDSVIEA